MGLGIFNFLKKIKKNTNIKNKVDYTTTYEKNLKLENAILFESYHGKQIASNEFYLLSELKNYDLSNLKVYVSSDDKNVEAIKSRLNTYKIDFAEVIEKGSREYNLILCTAKYLINSTSFPDYFIKRDGQVYLNTWHGTPLKYMGKKDKLSPHSITNIQRNFLMSDYILFPNNHTKDVFHEDYMLDNLYTGKYIVSGYPRNKIFYDSASRLTTRENLELTGKRVIAYMPTWRGVLGKVSNQKVVAYTYVMVDKLSKSLRNDEILYVNLHYLMGRGIKLNDFDDVRRFPSDIETYEFLNACDVLITDYSSVMFDFANSGREIVLYTYDQAEYEQHRGTYKSIDDFPFSKVKTDGELIAELRNSSKRDYSGFVDEFCSNDSNDNSKSILDFLFHGKIDNNLAVIDNVPQDKERVLIYAGNLAKNGITTSLKSLISRLDLNEKNYTITFPENAVKNHINEINSFPKELSYVPYRGMVNFTLKEAIYLFLYHKLNISNSVISQMMDKIYKREIRRIYPTLSFDNVIQFNGYDRQNINLFARFDTKKAIYVHNDMWKEYIERKICHKPTMDYAYTHFDKIAVVTEQLRNSLVNFNCAQKNIRLVENVHDHHSVVSKSKLDITFDDDTFCNISYERLKEQLDDDNLVKFVNIARFSPEKGHKRLIEAFERVYANNSNTRLVIIGGHGSLFKATLHQAENSSANNGIIIIRSMSNPFSVLKRCDLFVFSSVYEGLGLVMLEALSVGVPVVSTDIPGPRDFLSKGYGTLLPDSEEGLYQGMQMFLDGKISDVDIDWDDYNNKAVKQFNNLFH